MRMMRPLILIGLICLLPLPALSQNDDERPQSPRWSYEIHAGSFKPDLPLYELFYGDDRESLINVSGSYRFKDWLELGAAYGHMRSKGTGLLTSSQDLGGSVEYQLNSMQIYSSFIFQRRIRQRAVPYVGLGLSAARYQQTVELQEDIDGTTDLGHSLRLGVRILIFANAPNRRAAATLDSYWKSYLIIEASDLSTKIRGTELGGQSLVLGFRMEFEVN